MRAGYRGKVAGPLCLTVEVRQLYRMAHSKHLPAVLRVEDLAQRLLVVGSLTRAGTVNCVASRVTCRHLRGARCGCDHPSDSASWRFDQSVWFLRSSMMRAAAEAILPACGLRATMVRLFHRGRSGAPAQREYFVESHDCCCYSGSSRDGALSRGLAASHPDVVRVLLRQWTSAAWLCDGARRSRLRFCLAGIVASLDFGSSLPALSPHPRTAGVSAAECPTGSRTRADRRLV
jgi:hypothetical protein